MSSGSFTPKNEHLGSFTKPTFGEKAKHIGFDSAATAIYEKGDSLVSAVQTIYPEANFTWHSANLFSGLDSNLGKYLEPARDVVKLVTDTLTLIREVLHAVNQLINLATNILKLIVDKVIDLLLEILNILNPSGSVHLLVIPPKIGNIGNKVNLQTNKSDTVLSKWAKNSEKTRLDFVDYLNDTKGNLPQFLQDDVAKLNGKLSNSVTGHEYLLSTIRAKLLDKTDLSRPMLCPVSHSAGVGIFIGSNALAQILAAWNKLNSIFSTGIKFPKPVATLPTNPVIVKHNLTELNPLENSVEEATKCGASPSLESILVTPIRPTNTIRGGLEYQFKKRHILIYKKKSDNFNDAGIKLAFSREVNDLLSENVVILGSLVSDNNLSEKYSTKLEIFSTMEILLGDKVQSTFEDERARLVLGDLAYHHPLALPLWSKVKVGKFEAGNWLMLAVDYYEITDSSLESTSDDVGEVYEDTLINKSYVGLTSEVVPFKILEDNAIVDNKVLQLRLTTSMNELVTPSAASPKWFAAGAAAAILPDFVSMAVNFLEMFRQYLHSLLDDALDWLTNLISLLDRTLQYLLRVVNIIDSILQLLQDLANLNLTLGASVMSFSGQGDANALIKEFEEYLDPSVVRSTGDTPEQVAKDTEGYEERMAKATITVSALNRRIPDKDLDTPGSIVKVKDQRERIQAEALKHLREGTDPMFPSVATVSQENYNVSPVFTKDMTTCGLILMAHSPAYGRIQLFMNLWEFLFGEDDDDPKETEEESMNRFNVTTDIANLYPGLPTIGLSSDPKALFSEDMKLVDDPSQSPFNFCP